MSSSFKGTFQYSFVVDKREILICSRGDTYELQIDSKPFSQVWEREKTKKAFSWDNKERKHDPWEVNQFGSNLDSVFAETSREVGHAASMSASVNYDEEAEQQDEQDKAE